MLQFVVLTILFSASCRASTDCNCDNIKPVRSLDPSYERYPTGAYIHILSKNATNTVCQWSHKDEAKAGVSFYMTQAEKDCKIDTYFGKTGSRPEETIYYNDLALTQLIGGSVIVDYDDHNPAIPRWQLLQSCDSIMPNLLIMKVQPWSTICDIRSKMLPFLKKHSGGFGGYQHLVGVIDECLSTYLDTSCA